MSGLVMFSLWELSHEKNPAYLDHITFEGAISHGKSNQK